MAEKQVELLGGPLDGWPLIIRGSLPDELRLPYSREMLELAGASGELPRAELQDRWASVVFPSEEEALGVAVYRRDAGTEARYVHAGGSTSQTGVAST